MSSSACPASTAGTSTTAAAASFADRHAGVGRCVAARRRRRAPADGARRLRGRDAGRRPAGSAACNPAHCGPPCPAHRRRSGARSARAASTSTSCRCPGRPAIARPKGAMPTASNAPAAAPMPSSSMACGRNSSAASRRIAPRTSLTSPTRRWRRSTTSCRRPASSAISGASMAPAAGSARTIISR